MNNFLDLLKMASFPIHKEGYKFILIFCLATIILAFLSNMLGMIGLVLTAWCIFFFRDPERVTPIEEKIIVAPADGVVTRIDYGIEAPIELGWLSKKYNKISIFLNVFNVHVNRNPVGGTVSKVIYNPGKFLSANLDEASVENERNIVVVKTDSQMEIAYAQVAGMIARRIVCDLKEGQKIDIGDRFGIIRFGSRMDIYLPEEVDIRALVGQTMIGGETIIARI